MTPRDLGGLLSALLVAYTIEFDNEFERHLPHVTALFGAGGPEPGVSSSGKPMRRLWLTSQPTWSNGMRFASTDGVPAGEFAALPVNLKGLLRWGYAYLRPPAGASASIPQGQWLIRPTRDGRRAQAIWTRLDGVVDRRWALRFGAELTGNLTAALRAVAGQLGAQMPLYLPMVGYADGMRTHCELTDCPVPLAVPMPEPDLSVLLSQVLLAYTLDYESQTRLSLALSANTLRVLTAEGVPLLEISRRSGTSREAVRASVGFLERHGLATAGPDPAGKRGKAVLLTPRGEAAQRKRDTILAALAESWPDRFGVEQVRALADCLRQVIEHQTDGKPTLALGLAPDPEGWRNKPPYLAQTRALLADPAAALPHHPVVLHRGCYPDGS